MVVHMVAAAARIDSQLGDDRDQGTWRRETSSPLAARKKASELNDNYRGFGTTTVSMGDLSLGTEATP
jgi:hypothetical protein